MNCRVLLVMEQGDSLRGILSILGPAGYEVTAVGTPAEGAVLNTATGAYARKFKIVVPVDGMSSSKAYGEQYTAYHLANGPGVRKRTTLTTIDKIEF